MWDTHTVCVQSFSSMHSMTLEKLKDIIVDMKFSVDYSTCVPTFTKMPQDSREIKGNFFSTARRFDWISNRSKSNEKLKNIFSSYPHFHFFIYTHTPLLCLQRHTIINVILMCQSFFFSLLNKNKQRRRSATIKLSAGAQENLSRR